jgi:HSP20 family protein
MHTINLPLKSTSRHRASGSVPADFRPPNYDCREQADALQLVVYVPGVTAAGVEIATRGPDLTVTARKAHIVRVNWQALHLERAQRDYQLRLRLGHGFDYNNLEASIANGILTITLPKRPAANALARLPHAA